MSLSQFITNKRQQHTIEAKVKSIKAMTELEREEDLRKVHKLMSEVKSVEKELQIKSEILAIKEKIFQYDSLKYSNNEIDPDRFYQSKIAIISEHHQLELVKQKLEEAKGKIKILLRHE